MKLSRYHIISFRLSFVFALVLVTYLATNSLELTVAPLNYDKSNHLVAFLILAFLLDFSFPNSRFNTAKIFPLIAYGFSLEAVQYFLPHRVFSFSDIGADILGLFVYALFIPLIKRSPVLNDRWIE